MSISGILSDPNVYQNYVPSQLQQVGKDMTSLQTSLASSDLTAARNAFATLMQDIGNSGVQSSQQTGLNSQFTTDLTAVGTALQSGDLTAAQKAFSTLQQDMQVSGVHRHHHHHHRSSGQNASSTLSTDLTAVGTALQSGDLTAARNAFATLIQDIANSGGITAAGNSSATNGLSNPTSSLFGPLQATNGTSQNAPNSSANTLLQALSLYGQVGQFNLSLPTTGLFSATG